MKGQPDSPQNDEDKLTRCNSTQVVQCCWVGCWSCMQLRPPPPPFPRGLRAPLPSCPLRRGPLPSPPPVSCPCRGVRPTLLQTRSWDGTGRHRNSYFYTHTQCMPDGRSDRAAPAVLLPKHLKGALKIPEAEIYEDSQQRWTGRRSLDVCWLHMLRGVRRQQTAGPDGRERPSKSLLPVRPRPPTSSEGRVEAQVELFGIYYCFHAVRVSAQRRSSVRTDFIWLGFSSFSAVASYLLTFHKRRSSTVSAS